MGYFDNLLDRVERKVNTVINGAKNTIKSVINSVTGDDTAVQTSPAQTSKGKVVSVMNPEGKTVEKPEDKLEISKPVNKPVSEPSKTSGKKTDVSNKTSNNSKLEQAVSKKFQKIVQTGVVSARMLKGELKGLSLEEQLNRLSIIEQQVNLHNKDKEHGLIDEKSLNDEVYVMENTKTMTEAKKIGLDEKEAKKLHYITRLKESLGSDFEGLSHDAKLERIELVKGIFKQELKADLYKSVSAKKCAYLQKNEKLIDSLIERQLQLAYLAIMSGEEEESVRFRNGHDIADAKKLAINVKVNSTEIADRMTADWDMKMLEYYKEAGQMPTAKEYGQGVQVSTSYMSNAAIVQYENRANEIKQNFYNGNSEYSFLTEEYLTESTTAIGLGAVQNKNMTSDEKASFLKQWDDHAQQYSDYDIVRSNFYKELKEYEQAHPEAKQGIEDIKSKYLQKYGTFPDLPKAAKKRYDSSNNEHDNKNNVSTQQKTMSASKQSAKYLSKVSMPKDIANALNVGDITITDAINEYHDKAYKAIFEDKELFHRNKVIATIYVRNMRNDLEELLRLSKFMSAVELISKNISPTIKEEYIRRVNLTITERSAIFGKDNQYATT